MDPALQADLGRAALPRLDGAAHDLLVGDEVGLAAQVRGQLALREGAEPAAEVADVRVLDVAGDDVADLVAVDLAPQAVGGREHALALLAAGAEEADDLLLAELVAAVDAAARRDATTNGTSPVSPGAQRVLAGQAERVGGRSTRGSTPGRSTPGPMWPG